MSTENKTEQITILLLLIIYDNYSKYIKSHQHYFDVTRRKRHILFSIDFPISPYFSSIVLNKKKISNTVRILVIDPMSIFKKINSINFYSKLLIFDEVF